MERYFVKVDNDNSPVAVYRIVDTPDVFAEELWLNGEWSSTTRLTKYLIDGEVDLNEVPREEAEVIMQSLSPSTT
jgi:hypothetical protein